MKLYFFPGYTILTFDVAAYGENGRRKTMTITMVKVVIAGFLGHLSTLNAFSTYQKHILCLGCWSQTNSVIALLQRHAANVKPPTFHFLFDSLSHHSTTLSMEPCVQISNLCRSKLNLHKPICNMFDTVSLKKQQFALCKLEPEHSCLVFNAQRREL